MGNGFPGVVVCVPWRAQPDRRRAYDRVMESWAYFGIPVVTSDSEPDQPFHRAIARNRAVIKAQYEPGIDGGDFIMIMCDADSIPQPHRIVEAIEMARSGMVVYPFNYYFNLPEEAAVLPDYTSIDPKWSMQNSSSGVFVARSDTYWKAGGMDERFEPVWGFEDSAFFLAASTLVETRRLKGFVYSFDHDITDHRDLTQLNPNFWRHQLYLHASGNPNMMKALIKR